MATVLFLEEEELEIPASVYSLAGFRAWALSDEFPERGRIDYLAGRVEVDMSPEDFYTHGTLKTEMIGVLRNRNKATGFGQLLSDRTRVSSPLGNVSAEPDIVLVADESLDSGRVCLIPKASAEPDRYIELEGAPELIVEIVSDASHKKDTKRLPPRYYQAGVAEFWLVDARKPELFFRIHRRGDAEFEPAPIGADGYQFSAVLGAWYRLDRSRNPSGRPVYDLRERLVEG